MKSNKKFSPLLILLLIPGLLLLWVTKEPLITAIAEQDIGTIIGCFTMLPVMYYVVLFVVWTTIIFPIGRKNMEKRLLKEHFHIDYQLVEVGLSAYLWVDETNGKIAILFKRNPFSGQIISAGSITELEIKECGSEAMLKTLELRFNIDGNKFSCCLFNSPERVVLRTTNKAKKAISLANAVHSSIQTAIKNAM
jgi:hypothetical protein